MSSPCNDDLWIETSGITRIFVDELFGQFRYDLDTKRNCDRVGSPRLMLLYGDNGAGKTTIIKTLFHLLAHIDKAGHKAKLKDIRFKVFQVDLVNSISVIASRKDYRHAGYQLSVVRNGSLIAQADYFMEDERDALPPPDESNPRDVFQYQMAQMQRREEREENHKQVIKALESLDIRMLWVTDRRKTRTTMRDLHRSPGAVLSRRQGHLFDDPDEEENDGPAFSLSGAVRQIGSWATRRALSGKDQGDEDVNEVYANIIEKLADAREPMAPPLPNTTLLIDALAELEGRSARYARFGLTKPLRMQKTIATIKQMDDSTKLTAIEVLEPYINSLRAKFDALEPIMTQLSQFATTLNSFYQTKKVSLNVSRGLRITSSNQETLSPTMLSSGEGQLLYILASTLMAQERASLFIVDEPEISLNAIWQRKLLGSLLDITQGAKIQFLMATHSIELLTQYSEFVLDLK
jgi:energy-coupling factor transporter ATP-binding protein EcfA2